MTSVMAGTQAGPATAQTTQRLEAAKAQISAQRVTVEQLQRATLAFNGEARVLDLQEQALRDKASAAEQALAVAQEGVRHAQAAALIDPGDTSASDAAAQLASAQAAAQAAQAALSEALAPSGPIGVRRADLAMRRAQTERQMSDAKAMLTALERHAQDAHAASGHALVAELGADYDAAVARLQAAYADAQAARAQLAMVGKRAEAAVGAWQASAPTAQAAKASAEILPALERRAPLRLGRAADIVGAYDALIGALEQGAGRVPAQVGRHALRHAMPLGEPHFAQHWVFAFLNSQTAHKPFEVVRKHVAAMVADVWAAAQPSATPTDDGPKAS